MKRYRLLIIGVFIGLIVGLTVGNGISAHSQPKIASVASTEPTTSQLLTLVNAERAKNGVAPLKEDIRLDASAQMKANDEVEYHYFGHVSPSNSPNAGKQGYLYINDTGVYCKTDSENLSVGNSGVPTAIEVVDGWISSPAHHTAMIDADYTLTGFGINDRQIVEHFCQQ